MGVRPPPVNSLVQSYGLTLVLTSYGGFPSMKTPGRPMVKMKKGRVGPEGLRGNKWLLQSVQEFRQVCENAVKYSQAKRAERYGNL